MDKKLLFASFMLATSASYFYIPTSTAADYDLKNFGANTPTKDEVIDALSQPPKTRGIKLETTKPKAVSMEVKFDFNSAQLTEQSKHALDPIGEALKSDKLADSTIVIEGHTDAKGSDAYNAALSKRRAESVKKYLIGQYKIKGSRLKAVGKGEQELLDKDNPESATNRRVQLVNKGS